MAGASMRAIKSRIKSVESTGKITKAMELVASSKLHRAKQREEATKPFYRMLGETIGDMMENATEKSIYLSDKETQNTGNTCYIVIAGDRGLAGGYNNNLFRMVREYLKDGDFVLPVGKKSLEHYTRQTYTVLSSDFGYTEDVGIPEANEIASVVCEGFTEKKYTSVQLVFTEFVNMLSQESRIKKLLPLQKEAFGKSDGEIRRARTLTIYEPSADEVLAKIIPQYISGMIYGAVCEAFASECAARRSAMSAANTNAAEMINTLTLHYNRARQAVITQEITEITAGSNS